MPDIYAIGLVIVLALAFDFINGFHDTANAIATCIATRSLSPRIAIIMSAFLNFVGAMVSTGVAKNNRRGDCHVSADGGLHSAYSGAFCRYRMESFLLGRSACLPAPLMR